MDLSDIV